MAGTAAMASASRTAVGRDHGLSLGIDSRIVYQRGNGCAGTDMSRAGIAGLPCGRGTSLLAWFLRIDPDGVHHGGLSRQFLLARREFVERQNVRDDIDLGIARHLRGSSRRHAHAGAFEQRADGQAVPVRHEVAADQRGRDFAAGQLIAVARRAGCVVRGPSAIGLRLRVDAVPHRTGGILCPKFPGKRTDHSGYGDAGGGAGKDSIGIHVTSTSQSNPCLRGRPTWASAPPGTGFGSSHTYARKTPGRSGSRHAPQFNKVRCSPSGVRIDRVPEPDISGARPKAGNFRVRRDLGLSRPRTAHRSLPRWRTAPWQPQAGSEALASPCVAQTPDPRRVVYCFGVAGAGVMVSTKRIAS